jgi:arylsulfatase A-like enzyme
MTGLTNRGPFALNDYKQHILHTLRTVGYRSTLVGIQHIAQDPSVIGYDEIVLTRPRHRADDITSAAVEFLSRQPEQPFFLSVGFTQTHRAFPEPSPAEDLRYSIPPVPMPDAPETRADMAAFKASARILDASMGAVLDALEANGLTENTLVISTTDHGIAFPGMKCNLTDHGIGVMLILRGPGGFSGGKVIDALVSHVDIYPTVCDLLEIDPPDWLQGKSMMPLIRGEVEDINDAVFAEVNYHAAYEPMRAVRTKRWKYIRRYGGRLRPILPNCDDSPSKTLWMEYGWRERTYAEEELYDLIFDPHETCNRAGEPADADSLDGMRARLDEWMQATNGPLLSGPVPAPSGAKLNDPDGTSPRDPLREVP